MYVSCTVHVYQQCFSHMELWLRFSSSYQVTTCKPSKYPSEGNYISCVFLTALKILTATLCRRWLTRTTDQWTWVQTTWRTRLVRTRRTSTAGCAGTEPWATTLTPFPASPARPSSEETPQKD